jgi:methyl-galactoside transport system substrate-binding protein
MKTVIITLSVSLIILTGCGQPANPDLDTKPIIGVVFDSYENIYLKRVRLSLGDSVEDRAVLRIKNSEWDSTTQNDHIDDLLLDNVDVLAVNLINLDDASSIILKAKEKNIPIVFFVGEEVKIADLNNWEKAYYLGAKEAEIGKLQGEMIIDYWNNNSSMDRNGDGKLQYIMLKGVGSTAADRTKYAIDAVKDAPIEVDKLLEFSAEWRRDMAYDKIKEFCDTNQGVEAIFCNNDEMALGAINALKDINYFSDKFIPVVGIDGMPEAIQAINDDSMLGTVSQEAEKQGKALFDICYTLACGKNINSAGWGITEGKYIYIPLQKMLKE